MTARLLKSTPKSSGAFPLARALRDYAALKARVGEVLIAGRRRVEKEMMRMRYHTGLLINEHVRLNHDRAAYGAEAVLKLEKDFDIDHTELNRYAQFAKSYPIGGGRRQLAFSLPWIHYRKLMIIKDDERRWELTLRAEKDEWSFEEIEARVRHAVGKDPDGKQPDRLPLVCLGPFFTYKIIRAAKGVLKYAPASSPQELLLDLGFKHRLEMSLFFPGARFTEGTIVTAAEGSFSLEKAEGAADDSLYTYKARVEEVLDGDTLKVDFHLGLGSRKGETIRLNHIDCPELDTPEGRAAKRFVESELAGSEFITLKSVRTRKEKWGRYLGDIFYSKNGSSAPMYLNQILLDKGYAVRVRM
ncbi:MAG: thermonuclease family protein [Candidatus Omnitrophica bacterium]|nr:thermonuclease family protein [Candidatus Omnitrophota bacterium]